MKIAYKTIKMAKRSLKDLQEAREVFFQGAQVGDSCANSGDRCTGSCNHSSAQPHN